MTLVAGFSIVAVGAPDVRRSDAHELATRERVVVDSIRIGADAHAPDALRTIVIVDGRIAAIAEPGTVVIGPADRLIRGTGRFMVTGQTILLDGDIDLLDLRKHFVTGVTTALLPDGDDARCLATLAAIPSMRVPRVRLVGPDHTADPSLARIEVGALADLVIRDIPDADRRRAAERSDDPPRLLITARAGADPAGILIVYPGELAMLSGLLARLGAQLDASLDALPHALDHFWPVRPPALAPTPPPAPSPTPPATARTLITIDALPRGVVWTWSVATQGGGHTRHTLVRLVEPINVWAHVEEHVVDLPAGDATCGGRLVSVTVALLRLNAPALRDRRGDPADFWSRQLPIERTEFTIRGDRLVREPRRGTEAVDGAAETSSIPIGHGPIALMVGGVPTARSASLLGALAAVERDAGGKPGGRPVTLLHVGLDPSERGVTVREARLRPSNRPLCLPNRPRSGGGGRVSGGTVVNGVELHVVSDGLGSHQNRPDAEPQARGRPGGQLPEGQGREAQWTSTLWVDSSGTLRGLLEQTPFGVFALIPDDSPDRAPTGSGDDAGECSGDDSGKAAR